MKALQRSGAAAAALMVLSSGAVMRSIPAFAQAAVQQPAPQNHFHEYRLTAEAARQATEKVKKYGGSWYDFEMGIRALLKEFAVSKGIPGNSEPIYVFGSRQDGAELARILNGGKQGPLIPVIAISIPPHEIEDKALEYYMRYRGSAILTSKGGTSYYDLDEALIGGDKMAEHLRKVYQEGSGLEIIVQPSDKVTVDDNGLIRVR